MPTRARGASWPSRALSAFDGTSTATAAATPATTAAVPTGTSRHGSHVVMRTKTTSAARATSHGGTDQIGPATNPTRSPATTTDPTVSARRFGDEGSAAGSAFG